MMKIHVCDDDIFFLEKVQQLLQAYAEQNLMEVDISVSSSAEELKERIGQADLRPDLLFLDIELDGQGASDSRSGLGVAKEINASWPSIQIAFLTNYISYATDVYDTNHFYYVLKDELESRLPNILKRYHNRSQKLLIKTTRKEWCFDMERILYLERGRRSCEVVTVDGKRERISVSFEQMVERLTNPYFLRCHNSFLINLSHLRSFQSERIELDDGTLIPVSRTYRDACRERFLKWQEIWI